jgi:hypothetical protein
MSSSGFCGKSGLLLALGVFLNCGLVQAQPGRGEPGRSIGTVTAQGGLIVMTLDESVLGKETLFDLGRRTLRFTPDGAGYRAENLPLAWDPELGGELSGAQVTLHNFAFPFSGKDWNSFSVGTTGSISFSAPPAGGGRGAGAGGARGGRGGGVTIGRFDQLQEAARTLVNTVPAICVFLKPRMSGHRYVKELADRVVITWDLTEPYGGIQDFTWVPTVNRFQAVLRKDGAIEMSYDQLAAKDAIVGLYPLVSGGTERELGAVPGEEHAAIAAHLDIRNVKVSAVGGLFLKVTLETRGPVLAAGDAGVSGVTYRILFGTHKPLPTHPDSAKADVVWTIRGFGGGRGGRGGGGPRYFASGPGVLSGASAGAKTEGNTISIEGMLPEAFRGVDQVAVGADVSAPGTEGSPSAIVDEVPPRLVKLAGIRSPEVDLSSVKRSDGPFPIVYESFHYMALPSFRDLACTVIKTLGDKFDFLAYYSDFRVDNQEAGTPSDGPRGGNVSGIGERPGRPEAYCSTGRFQWEFIQPIYVGANQMQEHSPEGVTVERGGGKMTGYNLAMSQIGHELGHRWTADASAKVNGETIPLGPTHWARGLQAQVAFPYRRLVEASAMGGGVWQDNYDGTFTQLDDDYYVPADGYSPLDLYLMGLAAPSEVPDFFILRNLVPTGARDANGHPIFKADRTKLTIDDVIAAEGPRMPPCEQAQKEFNTGMVMVVTHGSRPSKELVERTNGIRLAWIDYWATTTGHRSKMTTNPR